MAIDTRNIKRMDKKDAAKIVSMLSYYKSVLEYRKLYSLESEIVYKFSTQLRKES